LLIKIIFINLLMRFYLPHNSTISMCLDHDQGRRWDGRHRHLALVMPTDSFLARQRWTPADPEDFSPLESARRSPRSIARCLCGSSRMSCYGLARPTTFPISVLHGSTEVVLGQKWAKLLYAV